MRNQLGPNWGKRGYRGSKAAPGKRGQDWPHRSAGSTALSSVFTRGVIELICKSGLVLPVDGGHGALDVKCLYTLSLQGPDPSGGVSLHLHARVLSCLLIPQNSLLNSGSTWVSPRHLITLPSSSSQSQSEKPPSVRLFTTET